MMATLARGKDRHMIIYTFSDGALESFPGRFHRLVVADGDGRVVQEFLDGRTVGFLPVSLNRTVIADVGAFKGQPSNYCAVVANTVYDSYVR
jgi:hypothetical protein